MLNKATGVLGHWVKLGWLVSLLAGILIFESTPVFAQSSSGEAPGKTLHLPAQIHTNAKLVQFKDNVWQFQLAGEAKSTIRAEQVVRWGSWRGIIGRQAVWLSDGSWLAGDVQFGSNERIQLQGPALQTPSISTASIRAIILQPVASLADWQSLTQALQNSSEESDSVWLRDRVRISCRIHAESLTTTDSIEITAANERTKLELDQVAVLVFSPALHGPVITDPAMIVGLDDGSLLNVNEWRNVEDKIELKTASGLAVASQDFPGDLLGSISFVAQQAGDKVQRLDGLKPASYRHVTDSTLEFQLGVNKDIYGNPLIENSQRHAGIVFHGLALHSSAQVAYRWNGGSAKLLSEVRMAANVPKDAHANCKVLLARSGQLITAQEFELSQALRADSVHLLDIDISNAQLVVLVVEKGSHSQFGDHVLWLDARIVKN